MGPASLGGNDDDNDEEKKLHVRVRFGDEIDFDDLIREHEAEHGRLWKYCGRVDAEERRLASDGGWRESWESSSEERALYGRIVRRIETRLDAITREVCG